MDRVFCAAERLLNATRLFSVYIMLVVAINGMMSWKTFLRHSFLFAMKRGLTVRAVRNIPAVSNFMFARYPQRTTSWDRVIGSADTMLKPGISGLAETTRAKNNVLTRYERDFAVFYRYGCPT